MKSIPVAEQLAELFEFKDEPVRSFVDTGWGRFPIALDKAGLNPQEFALYVRISIYADTREDIPKIDVLADHCRMSQLTAKAALASLQRRSFIKIEGDVWTLTDPTEWLPQ